MKSVLLAIGATAAIMACGDNGGSSTTTSGDTLQTGRTAVLAHINQLRTAGSLPALTEWTAEESCADGQAHSDFTANASHATFGNCSESAQSECPTWASVSQAADQCVQQMWNEGPGSVTTHGDYLNLSSTTYTKAAIGIYTSSGGSTWVAIDLVH
jgi:hypothetical protein